MSHDYVPHYYTTAVTVGIVAAEYTASEEDCSVAVEIRLLGLSDIPLTLFLSTNDQTATSGEDYVSVSMMPVIFNPSNSLSMVTQSVTFQLINDATVENSEQFEILLENGESLAGVGIDRNMTIVIIQDNDCEYT